MRVIWLVGPIGVYNLHYQHSAVTQSLLHLHRYYDQLCAMESKLPIAEDKVCAFERFWRSVMYSISAALSCTAYICRIDQYKIHVVRCIPKGRAFLR